MNPLFGVVLEVSWLMVHLAPLCPPSWSNERAPHPPTLAFQRRSRQCEHNRFLRVMVKTRFLRLMVVTLSGAVLEAYFLQKKLAFCD